MYSNIFRHPMVLKNKTIVRNSVGQSIESYAGDGIVWCAISPASAADFQTFNIEGTSFTHKITCRYHPSITIDSKLAYLNRTYDIVSLLNTDEHNEEYVILASEVR